MFTLFEMKSTLESQHNVAGPEVAIPSENGWTGCRNADVKKFKNSDPQSPSKQEKCSVFKLYSKYTNCRWLTHDTNKQIIRSLATWKALSLDTNPK